MNFLNKWERKFGKYAIHNLIRYIMVLYGVGIFLGMVAPDFYYQYLSLDISSILHGQVWRLLTFVIEPNTVSNVSGVLLMVLKLYLYLILGSALENAWGAFRFNLFIFSGYLFNVIGAVICYFVLDQGYPVGMDYTYQAMFFAFAAVYPDMQFLLFFIIPVKVKWLAILDAVLIGWDVIKYARYAIIVSDVFWVFPIAVIMSLANFLVFFFATRGNASSKGYKGRQRSQQVHHQVKRPQTLVHRCAVCGRTSAEYPNLEFRYCSKCKGNYEYCNEHLFTHSHVS